MTLSRTTGYGIFVLFVLMSAQAQGQGTHPAFFGDPFDQPVGIANAGDGTNRMFVIERAGIVWAYDDDDPYPTERKIFLDIRSEVSTAGLERGLLGLAFHPEYPDSPYFYVNYTDAGNGRTVIGRFSPTTENPDTVLVSSQLRMLQILQPNAIHNGGALVFGPDGYLYIGMGDGGPGGDPNNRAQDLTSMHGSVLRIDVDQPSGSLEYTIPPDNPFVGNMMGYAEEIWAYGFRNAWRMSFDDSTGILWLGDVGQADREEIDHVEKGKNYGWKIMEGTACFDPPVGCDTTGLEMPVWEYPHSGPAAVTGGYVYHGPQLPWLAGKYICGDYVSGTIFALERDSLGTTGDTLLDTPFRISSFGVDEAGEIYLCDFVGGGIYRIAGATTGISNSPALADRIELYPNFPNPFGSSTQIRFSLDGPGFVEVEVFDVRGRRIRALAARRFGAGPQAVAWDGSDGRGAQVPSGVYFFRVSVDGRTGPPRRMVLVR